MLENLYEFRQELLSYNLIFAYNGPLSHQLMVEIGDTLKTKLQLDEISKSAITKIFSILIEKTQNIIHYSAEKISKKENMLSMGSIAVGFKDNHYFVICGNLIENKHTYPLEAKLSKLQKMDKNEIKQYYKEQRKRDVDDRSKGAGLGLIEMARKAGSPIEFYFRPVDSKFTFFSVKTTI